MATDKPAGEQRRDRGESTEQRRARIEETRQSRLKLEREVMALKLAGRSFDQIAHDLGYANKSTPFRVYQDVMRRTVQVPADELRALSEARLEELRFAHWRKALAGDGGSTKIILSIEKQLADLRGLNAPKEIDLRVEAQEIARRYGLDPEEVMAEAEKWLAEQA